MKGRARTLHSASRPAAAAAALLPLLFAGLIPIGCEVSRATDGEPARAVAGGAKALHIVRGDLAPRLLLTGELEAAEAVPLTTPNADLWPAQVQWLAEDGTMVEAGDVVVEFDVTPLLSNIDELQAAVIEAENRLISERAQVSGDVGSALFEVEQKRAERDKARLEADIPADFFAAKEYAERQLALDRAELRLADAERRWRTARAAGKADIEVLRIALTKAREAVEKAEHNARRLILTAPQTGIFLIARDLQSDRRMRPGDSAWPGQTVGRLPDLSTLRALAQLFDVDDGRIEPGQRAIVRLDAFPDRPIGGRVVEVEDIAVEPHANSLRRFFDIAIELDEVDPRWMRPGMSVKVEVEAVGEALEDTLLIPRAALDWSAGKPRVRLVDGPWIALELGPCDAFFCALSGGSSPAGLAAGDALSPVRGALVGEGAA